MQRYAVPVLVALAALGLPIGLLSLPHFKHSCGLVPLMPADNPATDTVKALQASFGVGAIFPTTLLLVPTNTPGAANSTLADAVARGAWLRRACEALQAIARETNGVPAAASQGAAPFLATAFSGVMILNGTCTSLADTPAGWSHVGGAYAATSVGINYAVDPFGAQGQAWIQRLRGAVRKHAGVATWYVGGQGPVQMDVANRTYARFPAMVCLMMAVVALLIGASTRSLVAPLRAVLCLAWMLVVTFGLAIFTFQDGMLDWLGMSQLATRSDGAMNWISPCMAFSVCVGLGLDYDIFYSEAVLEERHRGLSGA